MKKISQFLCLLLSLILCLGILAGCGKKDPGGNSGTTPPATTPDPNEPDPLDNYDFDWSTYTILSRTSTVYEVDPEQAEFDNVGEAIWNRNNYVSEKYKVDIQIKTTDGDWAHLDKFTTMLDTAYNAGFSEYSLISVHRGLLSRVQYRGYLENLCTMPNMYLQSDWWCKNLYDNGVVNGALYIMAGDITYSLYSTMQGVFFNRSMASDYELGDLYETVDNDDWTWEKMQTCIKAVSSGFSDGGATQEYSLLTNNHAVRGLITAWELPMMVWDESQEQWAVSHTLPEKTTTAMESFANLLSNEKNHMPKTYDCEDKSENPIFVQGHSLFYMQKLNSIPYISDNTNFNWGLLPYPKYDTNQLEYITPVVDHLTTVSIPGNLNPDDKLMVGTVTEMLCRKSFELIRPAYYESTLKLRYSDPDMVWILDLMRNTLSLDFKLIYSVDGFYAFFTNCIVADRNFTSSWSGKVETFKSDFEKVYADLAAIQERLGAQ